MIKRKYSFKKGWNNLRVGDRQKAKEELKRALSISNDGSFRNYRRGIHYMTASQYLNVEKVFKKFNVTEIWDEN